MVPEMKMLMVIGKNPRLVPSHRSTHQWHILELHSLLHLSKPLRLRRVSQPQSKQLDYQPLLTRQLLLDFRLPNLLLEPRTLHKDPKASANMVAMGPRVHKNLRSLQSLSMLSASKLPLPKAHLKVIQVNKRNPNHSRNLGPSPRHRMSSPLTTPPISNSAIPLLLTTITSNNMACNRELRASRMVLHLNDRTAVMVLPNLRVHLNFPRVQLNSPSHVSRLRVKVKLAATPLQTQLPKLSTKEPVKEVNLNLATLNNNRKLPITRTDTPITRAHIMLNT
jgi:hypothetical protein